MFKPGYPSLRDYMYNMVFTFLSYIVQEEKLTVQIAQAEHVYGLP